MSTASGMDDIPGDTPGAASPHQLSKQVSPVWLGGALVHKEAHLCILHTVQTIFESVQRIGVDATLW